MTAEGDVPEAVPDRELRWRNYALQVDLYKHHLDLLLRFNLFFYATTGAIVTYYLAHDDAPLLRLALLLPILMGIGLALISSYGGIAVRHMVGELDAAARQLGLHASIDVSFLAVLLRLSGTLFIIVAAALIVLFFLAR